MLWTMKNFKEYRHRGSGEIEERTKDYFFEINNNSNI